MGRTEMIYKHKDVDGAIVKTGELDTLCCKKNTLLDKILHKLITKNFRLTDWRKLIDYTGFLTVGISDQ